MANENQTSIWRQDARPWWAPDAQGFVIFAIIVIVAAALFYRMTHPSDVNDKLLDTMLTILYGTALVAIINYLFGSSRGSQAKDETQSKMVEKLTQSIPPPQSTVPEPLAPAPWWTKLTPDERTKIEAATTDVRAQKFMIAAKTGSADTDDLAYIVTKGYVSQDRATEIVSS